MEAVQRTGIFPDTRWSLILRLRTPEPTESVAKALNELCQIYWPPLYAYLRRTGRNAEEAKDMVQGFLASFLSKNGFAGVNQAKGRFRGFLLSSLRNYIVSEARREAAVKRGGGVEFVQMDVEMAEEVFQTQAPETLTPEAAFDRQWATTVMNRALQRLREEQRARGKEKIFDALKPGLTQETGQKREDLAAATGLSASAVAMGIHRLRRRLRELVLDELSQTVGDQGNLDEELSYFLSIWSRPPSGAADAISPD
jgi:RNA polymerase sigma-70 factor (ECF subfamily)